MSRPTLSCALAALSYSLPASVGEGQFANRLPVWLELRSHGGVMLMRGQVGDEIGRLDARTHGTRCEVRDVHEPLAPVGSHAYEEVLNGACGSEVLATPAVIEEQQALSS